MNKGMNVQIQQVQNLTHYFSHSQSQLSESFLMTPTLSQTYTLKNLWSFLTLKREISIDEKNGYLSRYLLTMLDKNTKKYILESFG